SASGTTSLALTAVAPAAAAVAARAPRRRRLDVGAPAAVMDALRQHLALVDPHLHADTAVGGLGLVEAVVDVGPQRVQRHPAVGVVLRARHLGATEPPA